MQLQDMLGKIFKVMEINETKETATIVFEEVEENAGNHMETFFTKEQISEIINKRNAGVSLYQLAKEYQCSRTPIRRVLEENMVSYEDKNPHSRSKRNSSLFSVSEIEAIIKKRKEGRTYQKIAEEYGCTPQGIKYICDKEKRKKIKAM